jgi:hypothetical protein
MCKFWPLGHRIDSHTPRVKICWMFFKEMNWPITQHSYLSQVKTDFQIRIGWVHPVVYWRDPMYHYNDRLTQLFTKYKYIWLWLQCFDPFLGHSPGIYNNLESVVHIWVFMPIGIPGGLQYCSSLVRVVTKGWRIAALTSYEQYCKSHGIPFGIKNLNAYYTF